MFADSKKKNLRFPCPAGGARVCVNQRPDLISDKVYYIIVTEILRSLRMTCVEESIHYTP